MCILIIALIVDIKVTIFMGPHQTEWVWLGVELRSRSNNSWFRSVPANVETFAFFCANYIITSTFLSTYQKKQKYYRHLMSLMLCFEFSFRLSQTTRISKRLI